MKKIERIYIVCCKRHIHLTKICVASIRYWYPNIPISLIKDHSSEFDTSEIEKYWNVSVLKTPNRIWCVFTKLEAFFLKNDERVLVLDSDIVFVGKIIDTLEQFDEDFVVSGTIVKDPNKDWVQENYFTFDLLQKEIDEDFVFPGFVFNSGQMVITCGKITQNDLSPLIDWNEPVAVRRRDILKYDQGVLNYILMKKASVGDISLKSFSFKTKAVDSEKVNTYELSKISQKEGYPAVIHWMSKKAKTVEDIKNVSRSDLLFFYQQFYRTRIPWFYSLYKKIFK